MKPPFISSVVPMRDITHGQQSVVKSNDEREREREQLEQTGGFKGLFNYTEQCMPRLADKLRQEQRHDEAPACLPFDPRARWGKGTTILAFTCWIKLFRA
ncbi:hypothetical protein KM043_011692 [Ampulex compressa]|nr:hypothetical protein KM043_011692 [Ampulex compressa]